ncbi:hypothetical protein Anapl_04184 [Anas platyrhynchos]|uniref:Uncharacterized protein n=1 Tax=Anas platyrhynchos TaxID=8839 RepID=R0JNL8_ANAPL|nr:hypothetical protein Anapl_04184 [Anas platyrhynchos]
MVAGVREQQKWGSSMRGMNDPSTGRALTSQGTVLQHLCWMGRTRSCRDLITHQALGASYLLLKYDCVWEAMTDCANALDHEIDCLFYGLPRPRSEPQSSRTRDYRVQPFISAPAPATCNLQEKCKLQTCKQLLGEGEEASCNRIGCQIHRCHVCCVMLVISSGEWAESTLLEIALHPMKGVWSFIPLLNQERGQAMQQDPVATQVALKLAGEQGVLGWLKMNGTRPHL